VPGDRVGSVVEELEERLVLGTAVDEMHFGISLGCSTAMGVSIRVSTCFGVRRPTLWGGCEVDQSSGQTPELSQWEGRRGPGL
jgi:hypothetical protein